MMRALLMTAAMVAAGAAAGAPAAVEVTFSDPDRFSDLGPVAERSATLAELRLLFKRLAEKRLADGDRLWVEVVDVDLAGHLELDRSGARDVRISREAYPPRLTLRYRLARGGDERSGQADLTDLSYLQGSLRCRGTDPLCREARMVDAWLEGLHAGRN